MTVNTHALWSVGLEPSTTEPVAQLVADALWRRIAFGIYSPGERLPRERQLAEELGVSRATLRTAIRALNDRGVLETTIGRNGGSSVSTNPPSRPHTLGDAEEMLQNYSFRIAVEPPAARLAAERASRREIEAIVQQAEAPVEDDYPTYRAADSRFHLAIAQAAGNHYLLDAIRTARAGFYVWADAVWLAQDFEREVKPCIVEAADYHRRIAVAIARGSAEEAESAMRDHLVESLETAKDAFHSLEGPPPASRLTAVAVKRD